MIFTVTAICWLPPAAQCSDEATCCAVREIRVMFPTGRMFMSSAKKPDPYWGPRSLLFSEYTGLFRRGWNQSSEAIVAVKSARSYAFTPPYVFRAWCLFKHSKSSATLPALCGLQTVTSHNPNRGCGDAWFFVWPQPVRFQR